MDFFGRTGSGKTTLARTFLRMADLPFVVFDPKRRYRDGNVPVARAFNKRKREQIVRPDPDVTGVWEEEFWSEQFYEVWKEGNRIVYVDEVVLVNPSTRILLPEYSRCIMTGRERDVAVWSGTQRPSDIPSRIFTETEHFAIFRLQFGADREKVARFTSDGIGRHLNVLQKSGRAARHDWVYFNVDDDRIIRIFATKEAA